MAVNIQLRRDTSANWSSVDPILADGEIGIETDTLKAKVGNGVDTWTSLSYFIDGAGGGGSGDVVGPASSTNDHIAVFSGATGKLIKDGGRNIADLFLDVVGTASLSGGTLTVNSNAGRVRNFNATMTASATLSVTNLPAAGRECEFEMLIKQDATGGHVLTLPASFRPLGGSDTAIATAANAMTMISAKSFDGGSMWVYAMQEVG